MTYEEAIKKLVDTFEGMSETDAIAWYDHAATRMGGIDRKVDPDVVEAMAHDLVRSETNMKLRNPMTQDEAIRRLVETFPGMGTDEAIDWLQQAAEALSDTYEEDEEQPEVDDIFDVARDLVIDWRDGGDDDSDDDQEGC